MLLVFWPHWFNGFPVFWSQNSPARLKIIVSTIIWEVFSDHQFCRGKLFSDSRITRLNFLLALKRNFFTKPTIIIDNAGLILGQDGGNTSKIKYKYRFILNNVELSYGRGFDCAAIA